jgi:hypothetical protein
MRNVITFVLISLGYLIAPSHAEDKGVNIEITLADLKGGGGSSCVDSVTQTKNKGILTSNSGGKMNYKIMESYELKKHDKGTLILVVELILEKKGQKDQPWTAKIEITKNGKLTLRPFDGIEMTVDSKGVLTTS